MNDTCHILLFPIVIKKEKRDARRYQYNGRMMKTIDRIKTGGAAMNTKLIRRVLVRRPHE